jgi:hypothetical protein
LEAAAHPPCAAALLSEHVSNWEELHLGEVPTSSKRSLTRFFTDSHSASFIPKVIGHADIAESCL